MMDVIDQIARDLQEGFIGDNGIDWDRHPGF
jgi:hypothetical protein